MMLKFNFASQEQITFKEIYIYISQYYSFYCITDQINEALESIRNYFKDNHIKKKVLTPFTFQIWLFI